MYRIPRKPDGVLEAGGFPRCPRRFQARRPLPVWRSFGGGQRGRSCAPEKRMPRRFIGMRRGGMRGNDLTARGISIGVLFFGPAKLLVETNEFARERDAHIIPLALIHGYVCVRASYNRNSSLRAFRGEAVPDGSHCLISQHPCCLCASSNERLLRVNRNDAK